MDDPTHMTLWGEEVTTKHCSHCKEHFPATDQYFVVEKIKIGPRAGQDRLSSRCRDCRIEATQKIYKEKREYIQNHKKLSSCEECGYDDYRALVHHHRDPSTKSFEIAAGGHKSYKAIDEELDKCAVLCQNCHSIHHYEEGTGGGRPREYTERYENK
jgi:hypothetical protein